MSRTVMIVSGESSGELYGALLAESMRQLWPDVRVLGVGGERMRQAGVEIVAGIAGAFGLLEIVSSLRALKESFNKVVDTMRTAVPDVIVLIDYPDFNFRVAREAVKLGIRILYYVSPQVWAWRRRRVNAMRGFVDKMAVVLPFEEKFYRDSGIPCEFVGHPVVEDIEKLPYEKEAAKEALGIYKETPCLSILPGSRKSELKRHLPILLELIVIFKKRYPDYRIVMPLAPDIDTRDYGDQFERLKQEGVKAEKINAVIALSASEAAVIASGTATLQASLLEIPSVVIYRLFPLTYLIAKLVIRVKYAAIANLILGKESLPELLQGKSKPERIMKELDAILSDPVRRKEMIDDLKAVRSYFAEKKPSLRVAQMVGELAGWKT